MFKHNRDAVLYRIITAATATMNPGVGHFTRARGERLMTYRTNQNLEQCGRKFRRHAMILDAFTMSSSDRTGHA
jgi:hypothetical protein